MPRFNRRNSRTQNQNSSNNQNQTQNQAGGHGQPFPAQDDANSIPFYNARLFSMYESLIQSYTHFTYHANHMYHVLEQVLHGNRNSINSNPYPWLLIPHPQQHQPQQHQPQQHHPQQHHPQQHQPQQHQPQTQQPRPYPRPQPQPQPSASFENNIINALFGMINQPEERRLTPAQLAERIETVVFGNIVNPINTLCSITHDVFESAQQVSRIRHCGHIFNSDSLAHWLRLNNTCPTCRHNLLTDHPVSRQTTNATNANATNANATNERSIQIPLESEININTFYNELLRNSRNIPGFELNSVNDDSVVFSFDLLRGATGSRGSGSGSGPGRVDDVD
jgi:hypothetical protein